MVVRSRLLLFYRFPHSSNHEQETDETAFALSCWCTGSFALVSTAFLPWIVSIVVTNPTFTAFDSNVLGWRMSNVVLYNQTLIARSCFNQISVSFDISFQRLFSVISDLQNLKSLRKEL